MWGLVGTPLGQGGTFPGAGWNISWGRVRQHGAGLDKKGQGGAHIYNTIDKAFIGVYILELYMASMQTLVTLHLDLSCCKVL